MSQKLALVAAAAIATVQAKGFCATLGGANICSEQIEAALESEKISISGCVTVGGVQICGNNEETGLFEEEQQGFCVSYNGFQVCKEEVDAALESEKINITGCVTISGVQICKNSEETGLFEEGADATKKIKPLPKQFNKPRRHRYLPKTNGNRHLKVHKHHTKPVSAFEEDAELEAVEMETEQGKFWKRLGRGLKKIGKKVLPILKQIPITIALDEDQQVLEQDESEALETFTEQLRKIAPIFPSILSAEEMELMDEIHMQCIGRPCPRTQLWRKCKKNPELAFCKTKPVATTLEEDFASAELETEAIEMDEEQGKFWKRLGKFLGKVIQKVPISVVLDEDSASFEERQVALDEVEQGRKFWKRLGRVVEKIVKTIPIAIVLEEDAAAEQTKSTKPSRFTPEERKALRKLHHLKKQHKKPTKPEAKPSNSTTKPTKPVKKPLVVAAEESFAETQGFCVEYNGIKLCKEQIQAALEEEQGVSVTVKKRCWGVVCIGSEETEAATMLEEEEQEQGVEVTIKKRCWGVGPAQVCVGSEETNTGLLEEQQGICVEWKGIKVCKEQIEAALESEKINITGCAKIGKVEICKNSEETAFEQEQGFVDTIKGWFGKK